MFRYLVLGLLRDGRPRHGWALLAEYRARAGVEINSGSFYRELQRLVADRLARFADVVEEDARRRPYVILDAGRSAFDRWVASRLATVEPAADDEVACRAVFLAGGDRGRMRAALSEWQEQLWIAGKTLERDRLVSVERGADGGVRDEVLSLLLARRIKHVAADLEFVAEAASLFESLCERDDAALGVARADADSDEDVGGGDAAWDVGVAPETPLALAAAAGA
ncbi:MAG: PadR family transcriptional regulator, partial [Alphaproteobacteria bacterium]